MTIIALKLMVPTNFKNVPPGLLTSIPASANVCFPRGDIQSTWRRSSSWDFRVYSHLLLLFHEIFLKVFFWLCADKFCILSTLTSSATQLHLRKSKSGFKLDLLYEFFPEWRQNHYAVAILKNSFFKRLKLWRATELNWFHTSKFQILYFD